MKIRYRPTGINNFHNSKSINLNVTADPIQGYGYEGEMIYLLSPGQAKKVRKHFCGVTDCRCPHGAVVEYEHGRYGIPVKYVL